MRSILIGSGAGIACALASRYLGAPWWGQLLAGAACGLIVERVATPTASAKGAAVTTATPHPSAPVLMTGPSLAVERGGQYAAAVTISWPLSTLATAARVKEQAEKLGFVAVEVSDVRPSWWPGAVTADWYVRGVRSRPGEVMQRETDAGLSTVRIVEAFRTPRTLL